MRSTWFWAGLLAAACLPAHRPASDYCERTADMFCSYYLRCGRIAEDTMDACTSTFLETCNEVYEPHYTALAEEGRVALSRAGIRACKQHLDTVACDQQVFDLDGPCGQVWEGLSGVGEPCGLGIESFVCETGSTCVIGMDLCGTCESTVPAGESCGASAHCQSTAACVGGHCVTRGLPGDPCDDTHPCELGTSCNGTGTCVAPAIVGLGEDCDNTHHCPYRSACLSGQCVQTALLGESCTDTACASGWCDGSTCQPLKDGGAACESPLECHSLTCTDGQCGSLPGACFDTGG